MKKLLLYIAVIFSISASAQNYYVLGLDTTTGRPGYKYLQRPLYLINPLSRLNDSTIELSTVTVPFGGTGLTSLTAYALLAGGTTSTGNVQQVSGLGSSGQVLTSNGAGALPTWQNAGGGGTISGDGTATRIAFWRSSSAISGGANINIDSTNTRIGVGTSSPTHTITLDSIRSLAVQSGNTSTGTGGIVLYGSTDQTTNYNRGHIYKASGAGHMYVMANEHAGTNPLQFSSLYLNTTSVSVTYNGTFSAPTANISGVMSAGTSIGTNTRWDNSTAAAGNNNPMRLNNLNSYNASSTLYVGVHVGGTVTQSGTAGFIPFRIGPLLSSTGSGVYNLLEVGTNGNASGTGTQTNVFTIGREGKPTFDATNTAGGTTGAQTINKPSGSVNFAASATSLVVTNSLVSTSSHVFLTVETNDASAFSVRAVPASGSFTIYIVGTAPAAETKVGFLVIN